MSTKQSRNASAPSRAQILKYLEKRGKPVPEETLFQEFSIRKGANRDELVGRLERMKTEGQVLVDRRGRFFLPGRVDMIRGRVQGHPDGFGFLLPEHGGQDLFLSAKEMRKVLHGDTVLAKVRRIDHRGRLEGTVVEVLERGNETVVGRLHVEDQLSIVIPENTRISQDIYIADDARRGARHGQIVVAEILRQPDKRKQPMGRVVEVLGEHMEPGMEIEIAIRKYGIRHEWPEEVDEEAAAVSDTVAAGEAGDRLDLRDVPLVTIDGEDARDFDDAVHARRLDNGAWELIVAIADVTHYVSPNTGLDREAFLRGNSVYFPERVVPMLPEVLSNGICSLNPEVDRLCFACIMQIDDDGVVADYRFEPAVMRSHARLTYGQVAAVLLEGDSRGIRDPERVLPNLKNLHALSRLLNRRRVSQGTIELELPETRIVFDEASRKIQRIEPVQRNDAHRLIEECMLAANICAADFLTETKGPGIYRVHEKPDGDKIEDARAFLAEFGLTLAGGREPSPGDFAKIVEQCADQPFSHVVQVTLLRSLKQAEYSVELSEHFALGFERYTHFTSPIRRYPDLIVHRLIRQRLARGGEALDYDQLGRIAEHCSVTERRADEATRDVIQWLKAEFMLDRVGEEFDGVVAGVAEFGVFVELSELYVEGLVHVTALGEDYFHYDPKRRRLTGEHSGAMFQIGVELRVRVVRVDIDQAKIDFELVEACPAGEQKQRPGRQGHKGRKRRGRARKQ